MREGNYEATVTGALEDGATVSSAANMRMDEDEAFAREAGAVRATAAPPGVHNESATAAEWSASVSTDLGDAEYTTAGALVGANAQERDVTAHWLSPQREAGEERARGAGDAIAVLSGIGIGAALMYFFDPDRGARRRAMIRDQFAHLSATVPGAARATARDLSNRSRGVVAETRARFGDDLVNDDETIVARVRSAMGRVVSHPGSIIVTCDGGRVTVSGPILASETDALLRAIRHTRGVTEVLSQLEVHEESASLHVPGLQGGRERGGPRFELMQENWTPSARLLTTIAGGALAVLAVRRRDALGGLVGLLGAGLAARGVTNRGLGSVWGEERESGFDDGT